MFARAVAGSADANCERLDVASAQVGGTRRQPTMDRDTGVERRQRIGEHGDHAVAGVLVHRATGGDHRLFGGSVVVVNSSRIVSGFDSQRCEDATMSVNTIVRSTT